MSLADLAPMNFQLIGCACARFVAIALALTVAGCGDGGAPNGGSPTTGSIDVTLTVVGEDVDTDGSLVSLDDGDARRVKPGASIAFDDLSAGSHSIEISDVAANCSLSGDNPRQVKVEAGKSAEVELEVVCSVLRNTLTLSKIMVGVVPEGSDSLDVSALDERGQPDDWTASVEDPTVATVSKSGSQLTITGVARGGTSVRLTSGAGIARELPVKVYDRFVLDTGDLLIRYVDQFTWRWDDSGSGATDDGGFWHPVAPEGWHALGSLGIQGYGNPNGQYWMIVVKDDGDTGALAQPTDYYREYDDAGSGATDDGSFWTPVCPAGFVSLGAVAQAGYGKPSFDDVVCVRENLTVPGVAGPFIWDDSGSGASDWIGMWRIDIPEREDWSDTRIYLDPGTFVATGSEGGICSKGGCWSPPGAYPHMHVLAVDAPLLFDTGNTPTPRLSSYEEPSAATEPFEAKAMLVPFSSVLSGSQIQGRTHEFVSQSPFLRLEKSMQFHRLGWIFCGGSTTCDLEYTVDKGIEESTSETFSHSVGVSVTVEGGISFLGSGGKASVTVSYQFGYETSQSRTVFVAESWSASKPCPAESACAIWTDHTTFTVKKHLPTGGFAVLDGGQLAFDGGLSIWTDEYSENPR